jgi:hypothetical protein
MRIYLIDELTADNVSAIEDALARKELGGGMDGIYFLPVPEALLTSEQREHVEDCGPHVMAVETEETGVNLELLVRAKGKIRCSCIAYATPEQRSWAMDWLDGLIRSLDIPV